MSKGILSIVYKSIVGQLGSENVYCDSSWLAVRGRLLLPTLDLWLTFVTSLEEGHNERNPLGWGILTTLILL